MAKSSQEFLGSSPVQKSSRVHGQESFLAGNLKEFEARQGKARQGNSPRQVVGHVSACVMCPPVARAKTKDPVHIGYKALARICYQLNKNKIRFWRERERVLTTSAKNALKMIPK